MAVPREDLSLEVRDFEALSRFRWVLTEPGGGVLADHQVRLDPNSPEYEAFNGLYDHLLWRAAPDPWTKKQDEARIIDALGEWIGARVLGPIGTALAASRPVTVRVIVPDAAADLMFCPLELAHVGGKSLAVQNVSLVMQLGGETRGETGGPGGSGRPGSLRVLGLFSLPTGGRVLNMRHERQALLDVFAKIAASGRAIETRVLQYGVTRQRLREILAEEDGWDLIHISGHGAPGQLLLETDDGSPDAIGPTELADLLAVARRRLKLVTLSACWSAAPSVEGRLLGLYADDDEPAERRRQRQPSGGAMRDMAGELVTRLRCAVLAMRYPVADDFANTLTKRVYELLAGEGLPLPRALGTALEEIDIAESSRAPRYPALSTVTPTLFGAAAAGLTLAAPQGGPSEPDRGQRLLGFPPQRDRFVGRTAVMARAGAVLAPRSNCSGVLFHGIPGGGKTACALELAYTHEHAFERMAWFKVPDEGCDPRSALRDYADTLEDLLPGPRMAHLLDDSARLTAFLPELTELMRTRRVLTVVDNLESLLTNSGQWRHDPWRQVITALCAHDGLGRVVLTSRRTPHDVQAPLRVEPVDALSRDETLLLTRELRGLSQLIHGNADARRSAGRVLELAQGLPAMLELADGQASVPERIAALVTAGDTAWHETGGLPAGFFITGATLAASEDFLHVLRAWAQTAATGLPDRDRDLLWFLCCLEESDRVRLVAEENWARERTVGTAGLDAGLDRLSSAGLVSVRRETPRMTQSYDIHPVIASAGRAQADADYRDSVDAKLAAYWERTCWAAMKNEGDGSTSRRVKHAGIAAVPYLLRQRKPQAAATLLDEVLLRDGSRATARAIQPALTSIADAASGVAKVAAIVSLINVMDAIGVTRVEGQLTLPAISAALDEAVESWNLNGRPPSYEDYRAISALASWMIKMSLRQGRHSEASNILQEQIAIADRVGMGPWTRLQNEVAGLEILAAMGRHEEVLADVSRLYGDMRSLPASSRQMETATPWRVRETLLTAGQDAAVRTERWLEALDFNTAVVTSKRARGADDADLAAALFGSHGPLMELGRVEEARKQLLECRGLYEQDHDYHMLGLVLSALAQIEDKRGHSGVAIEMERNALRFKYLANDAEAIPTSHYGLAYFSRRHTGRPGTAIVHYLAAALVLTITGSPDAEQAVHALAQDLHDREDLTVVPATVDDLCGQVVAEVPGADLKDLLSRFSPEPGRAQQALDDLILQARGLAGNLAPTAGAAPPDDLPRYLAMWDPAIAGLVAADNGISGAANALRAHLTRIEEADGTWAPLARALLLLAEEPGRPNPAEGLDEVGAAIVLRARDAMTGKVAIPSELWRVMPWGYTLSDLVAAGRGDAEAAASAERELADFVQRNPGAAAMCAALRRVLAGERDLDLATALGRPVDRAVVTSVLQHIGTGRG